MGYVPSQLPRYEKETGEQLAGRSGGPVSLAIGIAEIFSGFPWLARLVSFWYHFAIMFEALFVLTTIDAGTRIARYLLQEVGGKVWPKFGQQDWMPAAAVTSFATVCVWGYFIWTGSIDTIWPMFGIANQLLAVVALAVAGTVMVNAGRARYLWVVVIPMAFVTVTTTSAGLQLMERFMDLARSPLPSDSFKGYLNVFLIAAMMLCVAIILIEAVRKWVGPAAPTPLPTEEPAKA